MEHGSIFRKITILTLAAILVSVTAIGGICIFFVKRTGDRDAAETMALICDDRRQTLDSYLNSIEQSVDMAARFAGDVIVSQELIDGGVVGFSGLENELPQRSAAQRESMDAFLRDHTALVEKVFGSVAVHTSGALTYYYRLNPSLSGEVTGFWFSKKGRTQFYGMQPTDISGYEEGDTEHVGWYYLPLRRGRPTWIAPYYNANMDETILSYVVPVYKAGTFIGIIGMDIDYDTLVEQLDDLEIYDTGYAVLMDGEGSIVYHPNVETGRLLAEESPAFAAAAAMLKSESSPEPIRYGAPGEERMMVFSTLANGLKLAVVAPIREINAGWQRLVTVILIAGGLILALFAVLSLLILRRLTEPLQRLTAASRLLAEGNYDISLDYSGSDEVGVLTAAFQRLVEHLQIYISDLNSKAYQDAMTGVKNLAAYNASAKMLGDAIAAAEEGAEPAFGVVMLDCNDLKRINDRYGHGMGDRYLLNACALICRVFTHSPVFRIGGDEFAVLLQSGDYDRRDSLMEEFDGLAAEVNHTAEEPWEQISVAKGMAIYRPDSDGSVEDVMRRADQRMYLDKQRMKALRKT